ncbi:MAG: TolC family protein [Spirochaetaceae bacterium]|jgi:outer membrane protein TolC|nr:TolC family protein [Spirochaetaceae bacterium]
MKQIFLLCVILFFCRFLLYGQTSAPLKITFKDAANLAIAASYELKNEKALQEINKSVWRLGWRAYLPKFTLQASEDDRLYEYQADSFQKNYTISVDHVLFDGGKLASSRKLEFAGLELGESRLGTASGEVVEKALSTYRDILTSREIISIRKTGYETLNEQRNVLKKEFELGIAVQTDIDEADISIDEARIEIEFLELEINEMNEQFLNLLGLETYPVLSEKIDVYRSVILPDLEKIVFAALERNQNLKNALLSIRQKKEAARFAAFSWLPVLRATGSFSVGGKQYPLTKYNWSLGISMEFAGPWLNGSSSITAGVQGKDAKTARLSGSFVPAPDPAASMSVKAARLALAYEQKKYAGALEQIARTVKTARENCLLADKKRRIALEAGRVAKNKRNLYVLKHDLGQITSLELMDAQTMLIQKEIAVIQAAVGLLEAERALESLLDLQPGELKYL